MRQAVVYFLVLCLVGLVTVRSLQAEVILCIDFNEQGPDPADPWITLATPDDAANIGGTGYSVDFEGEWYDSTRTGNASPLWSGEEANAADDYFWVSNLDVPTSAELTISGFDPGTYKVEWWASVDTLNRQADYQVNGSYADGGVGDDFDSYGQGYQNGIVLVWSSVTPTAGGEITLKITTEAAYGGGTYLGHLNALRVTPEPATMALLGIGFVGLGVLRRRRGRQ
jgi:hypothetical protein